MAPMPPASPEPALFRPPAADPARRSWLPWAVAAGAVLLAVLLVLLVTHGKGKPAANGVLPPAAYAAQLPTSGIQMSESTSLSGAKVTYIDGLVRNTGPQTVTAATVQVLFRNDMQLPPQVETTPLTLIRTHEPYIDTEPVSAAPLAPGASQEFRLIFENISENWNGQLPEIRVTAVTTR